MNNFHFIPEVQNKITSNTSTGKASKVKSRIFYQSFSSCRRVCLLECCISIPFFTMIHQLYHLFSTIDGHNTWIH